MGGPRHGDARVGGDRGHRGGGVPRDHAQLHALLQQEGHGLAGVGAQLLGQHHQAQRPQARGGRGIGGGGRQRHPALGEREHPPPVLGLGPRPGRQLLSEVEVLRRAEHERAVTQAHAAPAPPRGEGHDVAHRLRGARMGLGDRLERAAPGRRARGVAAERGRQLVLVDAVGRHQPHHAQAVLGEGAGLVQADHVGRRQRLHGVQLLAERAAPRHPPGGDRVGQRGQQDQALGDDRDHRGHRRGHGLAERGVLLDQRPPEQQPQGHHRRAQQQDEPVERPLEGRARVAELARLAHQALGVGVGAHGLRAVGARALDAVRPGAQGLAGGARDGLRLAGEDRLVEPQSLAAQNAPVGHHLVARAQQHQVSGHHLRHLHLARLAVAHHRRPGRDEGREPVETPLRAGLLHDPDARVQDQDGQEDRVAPVGEDQRDDAEEHQDHVEDGQQVGPQDAGPRAAGRGPLDLSPLGQPALGLGLGEALLDAGAERGAKGRRANGGLVRAQAASASATAALTIFPSRTLTPGRSSSSDRSAPARPSSAMRTA